MTALFSLSSLPEYSSNATLYSILLYFQMHNKVFIFWAVTVVSLFGGRVGETWLQRLVPHPDSLQFPHPEPAVVQPQIFS